MNCKLPDVQAGFRKGRETRDQIANIRWIMEKAREFQKNIYFCLIACTKAFDYFCHHKLWKILEIGILDHHTCLLRNLYAGQKATVITRHGTTHWFQNWERSTSSLYIVILLVYIMQNRGWMNHKLESRFPGEISTTSDTQMIPP